MKAHWCVRRNMMLTAQQFYLDRINKGVDVDGAYGAQCWDLFAYFCKLAGYPVIHCTQSGYARDIANQKSSNGLLTNFVEVSISAMQDGDWAIWGVSKATPYSHIAMFRKNNGNGTGVFLGQNQGGVQKATQINFPYAGILGVFRPKCYISTPQVSPKPSSSLSYTVRSGDTLSSIASKYGTTWQNLQKLNGIANANLIKVGQVLKIK